MNMKIGKECKHKRTGLDQTKRATHDRKPANYTGIKVKTLDVILMNFVNFLLSSDCSLYMYTANMMLAVYFYADDTQLYFLAWLDSGAS